MSAVDAKAEIPEKLEATKMKMTFVVGLILAVTLTAAPILNSPATAGGNDTAQRPVFAALSSPVSYCGRAGETGTANSLKPVCRSNGPAANETRTMAAVTCGSNQWCCRHEDFSKGTCAKCCPK